MWSNFFRVERWKDPQRGGGVGEKVLTVVWTGVWVCSSYEMQDLDIIWPADVEQVNYPGGLGIYRGKRSETKPTDE